MDGDIADGVGTCFSGAPDVDDGNPCTIDACDPMEGPAHVAAPAGTPCDDGDACNGAEMCDGAGATPSWGSRM